MKKVLLLLLFFCNSLYSQSSSIIQKTETQLDFLISNRYDLKDENGSSIFNSNDLDTIILTGEASGNRFGISVASAGDVNGDGFSDVIVGAYLYDNNIGRAYIFYGGSYMDNNADVTMTGTIGARFGYSVSTAGDVNGDGYSDVIVGAYGFNTYTGRVYVFYGGINMNNIADVIMSGGAINNLFGNSVSTAGDVNGDGYSDVIVGASNTDTYTGESYIFYGGILMNNIADVTMTGETYNNLFGNSVSTAGDVNKDGYSDVIIGAYGFSSYTGRAYIFYGSSFMNNIADIVLAGEAKDNQFGHSVSSAGDVNGDGYSDVIVGADGYSSYSGKVYLFYGGSSMNNVADLTMVGETIGDLFGNSVSTAGDLNKDGFSDVIIGAEGFNFYTGKVYIFYGGLFMNNIIDIVLSGEAINNQFGHSVSSIEDVNGDRYSDIIVGAFVYSQGTGRAYLYNNIIPKPILINPINNSINNPLSINFNWKKLNKAIYYILYVSRDSSFDNIFYLDTVYLDTSKIVNGFQKDIKYYWRVKAIDSSYNIFISSLWNFTTIPPIYINLKMLFEGMYSPVFNQLLRKDTVKVYLRNASPPFALADSSHGSIDSLSYSGLINFSNASSGTYYLVVKHFNCIETWSKSGGEILFTDGFICNYDFTTANNQAYGNNLKLKGSKFCIYSGDVSQDGFIDLVDVVTIYNEATNFATGNYLVTDLTGDGFVDLTDVTICYNNSTNFIRVRQP